MMRVWAGVALRAKTWTRLPVDEEPRGNSTGGPLVRGTRLLDRHTACCGLTKFGYHWKARSEPSASVPKMLMPPLDATATSEPTATGAPPTEAAVMLLATHWKPGAHQNV